jgi:hypothetical protein
LNDGESWLLWIGLLSALVFVSSAAAVPLLAARIPDDYFLRDPSQRSLLRNRRPLLRGALRAGRNILGGILLLSGIVMLFLPGQGVLTVLAGLTLLEFPGKRRIERALIRKKAVHRSLNWLRERRGQPPLKLP